MNPGSWHLTDVACMPGADIAALAQRLDSAAREREEIVARVASFRATQQRFERDRQEYYDNTLGNVWSGFQRRSA